eukprot:CAMPEP_0197723760 /NCGR_PEP_ID=MMETSP1434-20131217/5943_1 /TAXON_ID=265543 /ORGANISM="Minutocellus polymorphus, Strain CCMP3303" /LENGTH=118 /DNA_ID=CAMNT_0043309047 /DNA_START=388 /DNA_END=744 /DNA_ORIENTATION=+
MSVDLADAIVQAAERMKTQEDQSSYGALYYEKRVQTGFITGAPVREYCFRGANGRVYQEFSHIEDALHYAVLHGYRRMNKDDERHLVSTINEAKAANKMRGRVLFFFTTPLAQVQAAA